MVAGLHLTLGSSSSSLIVRLSSRLRSFSGAEVRIHYLWRASSQWLREREESCSPAGLRLPNIPSAACGNEVMATARSRDRAVVHL